MHPQISISQRIFFREGEKGKVVAMDPRGAIFNQKMLGYLSK